jgi:pimeloyl-ACP methyl ester carboxylesterase
MIRSPTITEQRVRFAGFATRRLSVEGTGPAVVLVHGFGHPADTWRPLLRTLAGAGQAAVAVDLPGFGDADPPGRGPRLPQLDAFLAAVIAAHPDAVVVGNSLGAALTLRAAVTGAPMAAAVLLAAAGNEWTPLIRLATCPISSRLLAAAPDVPRLRSRILGRLLYGDRRAIDRQVVAEALIRIPDRAATTALIRDGLLYRREVDLAAGRRIEVPADLPVTLVHGSNDRLVPVTMSRTLHAAIPHSRLLVLEGVGHCPQLDATETVARTVLDLASSPPQPVQHLSGE